MSIKGVYVVMIDVLLTFFVGNCQYLAFSINYYSKYAYLCNHVIET